MKTGGVFHISAHLQLTIKSLHVLFPSISLLKKQSTLKLQSSLFSFYNISAALTRKKLKLKKYKRENSRHNSVFYFRTKFETSNARGLVFFSFFVAQWLVKAFVYWGYLRHVLRGGGTSREFSEVSTLCGPPL